jgi:hypothetical protein
MFHYTVKNFAHVSGTNLTALHNWHTQRSRLIFEKIAKELIRKCPTFYVTRNLIGCVQRLRQFSLPTARLIQSTLSQPISSKCLQRVSSFQVSPLNVFYTLLFSAYVLHVLSISTCDLRNNI